MFIIHASSSTHQHLRVVIHYPLTISVLFQYCKTHSAECENHSSSIYHVGFLLTQYYLPRNDKVSFLSVKSLIACKNAINILKLRFVIPRLGLLGMHLRPCHVRYLDPDTWIICKTDVNICSLIYKVGHISAETLTQLQILSTRCLYHGK